MFSVYLHFFTIVNVRIYCRGVCENVVHVCIITLDSICYFSLFLGHKKRLIVLLQTFGH
jgi:hypothetical protein